MKWTAVTIVCLTSISAGAQISWYKCLSGKIDKYPVTVHLHKQPQQYSGYYYYNSTQQPIYFLGEDSTIPGKINLTSFLPGKEEPENLVFTLNEKTCTGMWANAGKTLAFSATEITQSPSWDYVFTEGAVKLRPSIQESPKASYAAAAVWPQGNSDQPVFLKRIINEWVAGESSEAGIGQAFLEQKKTFFDSYIADNKDVPDSDLVNSSSFNMEEAQTIQVVFQSSKLLTLANLIYIYAGGAHGNYGTQYLAADLVHNKRLTLDDMLSEPGRKQLPVLLEKYFRKAYDVAATDPLTEGGLFEDKIEPNKNFFVTGKGIGFNYTPYEIGPYAMGEIMIFIPFAELQAYLQTDFKSLLSD